MLCNALHEQRSASPCWSQHPICSTWRSWQLWFVDSGRHFMLAFLGFCSGWQQISNISAAQASHQLLTQTHCSTCGWQPTFLLGHNRSRLSGSVSDGSLYSTFSSCVNRKRNTQSSISTLLLSDLRLVLFLFFFCIMYLDLSIFPYLQSIHFFFPFIIHSHYSLAHTQSKQKPFRSTKPNTRLHKNDSSHMSL